MYRRGRHAVHLRPARGGVKHAAFHAPTAGRLALAGGGGYIYRPQAGPDQNRKLG